MNKTEFVKDFQSTLHCMEEIMIRKNSDYSGWDSCINPFQNFELVESLGVTTVEKWFLVRMCDKMSRISSLISNEAKVKDESITTTLVDLANYAIIMSLYLKHKNWIYEEDKSFESKIWESVTNWTTEGKI